LVPQLVTCVVPPACGGQASAGPALDDLLPHLRGLVLLKVECTTPAVVITARWWPPGAACPACGTWSTRAHGSYVRCVRDLPAGGRPVVIHLTVRRFLCQDPACAKVTFAGQADGLTARYQRWSVPLAALLSKITLELAGRAGTRLAAALGIAVHRGTLLRLVIDLPDPVTTSNAAIGKRMFLSEGAISKYTTSAFARLGITDDTDTNRRVLAVLAYLNAPPSIAPPPDTRL
jgi:hypothetical protein